MAAPYDILGTITTAARVKANDAILNAGAGQTLTDNASFTGTMVNLAWRILQNKLRAIGFTGFARLKDDLIVPAIPISASSDPGVNNYIAWAGFYNGATVNAGVVLPQEFMSPLVCWERPNAAANGIAVQNFIPMDQCLNGIPTNGPKQSRNLNWEWIDDQIRFPGSTVVWDLRLRCLTFLSDLAPTSGAIDPTVVVPILDCLEPLSDLIAQQFTAPRGNINSQAFEDHADLMVAAIYGRDTAQWNAVNKPADYKAMRNPYVPGVTPPVSPQGPVQGGS